MLVICNGNMKSGSTWLVQLVRETKKWTAIDERWRNPAWINPSVAPEKFDAFVAARDWHRGNYFCKQHWSGDEKYRLLLHDSEIRILTSVRDIKDATVSRYFHDLNIGLSNADSIDEWYFKGLGRGEMQGYISYHKFWTRNHGPMPHLVRYEELKANFESEVLAMFGYLDVSMNPDELIRLKSQTWFQAEQARNDMFMRKGMVGDWRTHLSESILEDLKGLCKTCGFTYRMDRWTE